MANGVCFYIMQLGDFSAIKKLEVAIDWVQLGHIFPKLQASLYFAFSCIMLKLQE